MTRNERSDDELCRLAHRLWAHWSSHIAEEEDISEERLERWRELWVPYNMLTGDEKQTDRELVHRFYYLDGKPDAYEQDGEDP